jgi:hypothetical protein
MDEEGVEVTSREFGGLYFKKSQKFNKSAKLHYQYSRKITIRIYAGWKPNIQRMYFNCWGHFADFLLEGICKDVFD